MTAATCDILPADAEGLIPPGSINYLAAVRRAEMSELRQEFSGSAKKKRRETSARQD